MDPMDSLSTAGGHVPSNFNAEDAGNMEDVCLDGKSFRQTLALYDVC